MPAVCTHGRAVTQRRKDCPSSAKCQGIPSAGRKLLAGNFTNSVMAVRDKSLLSLESDLSVVARHTPRCPLSGAVGGLSGMWIIDVEVPIGAFIVRCHRWDPCPMIHIFPAIGAFPPIERIACIEEDAAIVAIEKVGGCGDCIPFARCEEIAERSFERIGVMSSMGVCHNPILSRGCGFGKEKLGFFWGKIGARTNRPYTPYRICGVASETSEFPPSSHKGRSGGLGYVSCDGWIRRIAAHSSFASSKQIA